MTNYYLLRAKYKALVQGWRGGESTRLLPMWPGSNPRVLAASMSSVASNLFCFKCVIQVILVAPKQYAVVHSERKIAARSVPP